MEEISRVPVLAHLGHLQLLYKIIPRICLELEPLFPGGRERSGFKAAAVWKHRARKGPGFNAGVPPQPSVGLLGLQVRFVYARPGDPMGRDPQPTQGASAARHAVFVVLWSALSFGTILVVALWAAIVSVCSWFGIDLAPNQNAADD